jgi:hypothetical protein
MIVMNLVTLKAAQKTMTKLKMDDCYEFGHTLRKTTKCNNIYDDGYGFGHT